MIEIIKKVAEQVFESMKPTTIIYRPEKITGSRGFNFISFFARALYRYYCFP